MRTLVALTLCTTLLAPLTGCHDGTSPKVPGKPQPVLAAVHVEDDQFARSVERLLAQGTATPERSALLAGAVKRQLSHASQLFDEGYDVRGTNAVVGALYLLRLGERRPDMMDASSVSALQGAVRRFSARGDEGRALALMTMLRPLLPPNSEELKELDGHLASLESWMKETRTGGDMVRLAADERAAIGEALLDPSETAIDKATMAIDKWIARAVAYNVAYQQTRKLPPRGEVSEAYRALQTGAETLAALYLRFGRADGALLAIERTAADRIANPAFYAQLGATAERGGAEDWRMLARQLAALARADADAQMDRDLLEAALWGVAVEAYRRDPMSQAVANLVAAQLINFEMGEAAPLVLAKALGPRPPTIALDHAMGTIADALAAEVDRPSPGAARRIFDASGPVLALADQDAYRGRLEPSSAQVRQLMAGIELRHGEVDRARPLLEKALQQEPTVWGYTMLGTIERQVGNLDAGLSHAKRAVELPSSQGLDKAEAKLLAFEILRERGDGDGAADMLSQALEIVLAARKGGQGPAANVRAERTLARVLDGYGERTRARHALERAIDLAESHRPALAQTVLGAVGRALVTKDVEAARAALQTGLEADVDGDDLVYAALWLMLLEADLGQTPDGKVDRILVDHLHGKGWTTQLARWARGDLDDAGLSAAAKTYSEKTEASFYVSMRARIAGRAGADAQLTKVANNPLIDLMEVRIARDLLAPRAKRKIPERFDLP